MSLILSACLFHRSKTIRDFGGGDSSLGRIVFKKWYIRVGVEKDRKWEEVAGERQ